MKILALADEESSALWDYYTPGKLAHYDLILSAGDLKADYLSFLVTMARCPLMYVHGNHDVTYDALPPEGCDSIEDKLVIYRGLRILGLGGSHRYSRGKHQYSEKQMERRIRKLRRAIRVAGGVDILLTHSAPRGIGDTDDLAHRGFEVFLPLLESCNPRYMLHGHVHMNYGVNTPRVLEYRDTKVMNCCGKMELELDAPENPRKWKRWQRLYHRLFVKQLEIIA